MRVADLERDIDTERRKTATLQDTLKESEKEYHKLKVRVRVMRTAAMLLKIVHRPSTTS